MIDHEFPEQLEQAQETVRLLQYELAETNRGLVALAVELEDRVAQRTSELRDAHAELKRTNTELVELTLELEDRVNQRAFELKRSHERFLAFMNHSPVMAFLKDAEGRYLFVNEQWKRQFSPVVEEWQAKTDFDFWPEETARLFHSSDTQVWSQRAPIQAVESGANGSGEMRHWMVWKFPVEQPDGQTLLGGVVLDATRQIDTEMMVMKLNAELEQRVRERTAQLEAANFELEAFSYSVSHDLRAPLRAIDGFSRIIVENYASELSADVREHLGLVRDNTLMMARLIEDLLALARSGRASLQTRTVDMGQLVQQVLEELRPGNASRRIKIAVGDLGTCEADPILMKQVVVNLIANALKFTRQREEAVIEIGREAHSDHDGRPFFVRDNGTGFNMQYASKLFVTFQRLHRQEEFEGTGIGLAIVKRIVERHGGRVWADAQPDKGATFYFTLSCSGVTG